MATPILCPAPWILQEPETGNLIRPGWFSPPSAARLWQIADLSEVEEPSQRASAALVSWWNGIVPALSRAQFKIQAVQSRGATRPQLRQRMRRLVAGRGGSYGVAAMLCVEAATSGIVSSAMGSCEAAVAAAVAGGHGLGAFGESTPAHFGRSTGRSSGIGPNAGDGVSQKLSALMARLRAKIGF